MKYYCENCGMELKPPDSDPIFFGCPACRKFNLNDIPTHETVAQWEARKGRQYPDTAPVYYLRDHEWALAKGWGCCKYAAVHGNVRGVIVATEAGAPPDDWRSEHE